MSLDKLAIIFIIIILPISVVLNAYTDYQIKTLNTQISYDEKLNNATADAIKAYQLNEFNESNSNLTEVRRSNIKAAANTFLNSIGTNFNMAGFGKETLQEYVPALVFTMYDGYYVFSKYTNTLDSTDFDKDGDASLGVEPSTYINGTQISEVGPYVSYSCRYVSGNDDDFVITYSLDNHIAIEGKINGEWVTDDGYVIDTSKFEDMFGANNEWKKADDDNPNITYIKDIDYSNINEYDGRSLKYRGCIIKEEGSVNETNITEYPLLENYNGKVYKYHIYQGVKYYYNENTGKWFYVNNGKEQEVNDNLTENYDLSAYEYYKDAYNFTTRLINKYNLAGKINKTSVKNGATFGQEDGTEKYTQHFYQNSDNTFKYLSSVEGIEEPNSNFNEHRKAVIRATIEKNLAVAISTYGNYVNTNESNYTSFRMPELKETEWEKIMTHPALISFMQGLHIGGKIYNGMRFLEKM